MLSLFPGRTAGTRKYLEKRRRRAFFQSTFSSKHSTDIRMSHQRKSFPARKRRRESNTRSGGEGRVSHDTRTNFQATSTLTFPYDLLTGLRKRAKARNYVVISASGEIIGLTPKMPGKHGRISRRLKYTN